MVSVVDESVEDKAVAMAAMLEMAQRLKSSDHRNGVLVNVADPGWTRTGLTRKAPLPIRLLVRIGKPIQNTAEDSARVPANLAGATTDTGAYVGFKGPSPLSKLLRDPDFRRKASDESAALIVDKRLSDEAAFLASPKVR